MGSLAYAFFGVEVFSMKVLFAQLIGIGVGFVWAFGTGLVLFLAIKHTIGLRVTKEKRKRDLTLVSMAERPTRRFRSTIWRRKVCFRLLQA